MDLNDSISGVVEVGSFNDTLGELERVISTNLSEVQVIPVNFVDMYEVINEFIQIARRNRTTGNG